MSYINMTFTSFSGSLVTVFLYRIQYSNININISIKYGSQSSETSYDALVENKVLPSEEIKKTKCTL